MKKIFIYLIIAFSLIVFSGCTETMEDMNESPYTISTDKISGEYKCMGPITTMIKNIKDVTGAWQFQVQETLNADVFSGYFMHPGGFGATARNDNYVFANDKWNGQAFINAQNVFNSFLELKKAAGTTFTDYLAYGYILKVLAGVALVDAFGPYPYLNYGTENAKFDNVDDIYLKGFLPELDNAIDTLTQYSKLLTLKDRVKNSKSDITSLNGDNGKWLKLANTLRLRLAMRISYVAEGVAKAYVEKCESSNIGYLDDTDLKSFSIDLTVNKLANPFRSQSFEWDDLIMGADIYSFLIGYKDPRVSVFFLTSKKDTARKAGLEHNYMAMRQGCPMKKEAVYIMGSQVNFPSFNNFVLVSGAESYFLLAEAALKGWVTKKTAEQYYKDGVKASFKLFGVTGADAYLSSTNTPVDFVDIVDPANNFSATTNIAPKWDPDHALEQIMTQKWIANFPNGAESWAEFRRTGYPKIKLPQFMETGPNPDGTIPQGHFVTRLPYPTPVKNTSSKLPEAVATYLKGKDDGHQLLWWDVSYNTEN